MDLSTDEARLITVARAIKRFNVARLVPVDEASAIASYLPELAPIEDKLTGKELAILIDGFIAGIAADRLLAAGVPAHDYGNAVFEDGNETEYQTGVDPVSNEVRVPN